MPVFHTRDLLATLTEDVQHTISITSQVRSLSQLNKQPSPGKWSIAQILENLNSYNRFYLKAMQDAIEQGNIDKVSYNPKFRTGWFGNYFTKMMQPKANGHIANKMQSPKDHRPSEYLNASAVLDEFIEGQQKLLQLLQHASTTDIGKLRVPVTISRYVKLKLGDTFRFLIAHQMRHFVQLHYVREALGIHAV